jgi:hypothetical protein
MFINSYEELQEFIFRKLGSEQHTVELSDDNFSDIFKESLKFLRNYTNDGANEKYVVYELNNEKEIILNDNIFAVLDMYAPTTFVNSNLFYPGYSPVYDFLKMSSMDTSAYLVFTEQMKDIRDLFRKRVSYKFNTQSKKLVLHESITGKMLFKILEMEEEQYLYDSELFLKLIERDCWGQWAINIGAKYRGSSIGNGIELNTDFMMEKYNKLDEEIKAEMDSETYDFLAPFKI